MKERPILFSGPMVRAILEGRKTQTRRLWKPRRAWQDECEDGYLMPHFVDADGDYHNQPCPYGQPGDRLWVRETTCIAPRHFAPPDDTCVKDYEGFQRYVSYRADGHPEDAMRDYKLKWTPAIHVPRWASRIMLEVVAVRVERLREITDADALAEGVPNEVIFDTDRGIDGKAFPVREFQWLWESLNGPGSWEANPWVWVVEFKRMEGEAAGDCLQLATRAVVNLLRNGALCPNDTDGDGDCGRPMCPVCGKGGAA